MNELFTALTSWKSFVLVLVAFGFSPGFVLRLLVLLYPADHPRRHELIAELFAVPRIERPLWVAEQLSTVLFEGLPLRVTTSWGRLRGRWRALGANNRAALMGFMTALVSTFGSVVSVLIALGQRVESFSNTVVTTSAVGLQTLASHIQSGTGRVIVVAAVVGSVVFVTGTAMAKMVQFLVGRLRELLTPEAEEDNNA